IRVQGADRHQGLFRLKRRDDLVEEMIAFGNIAAHGSPRGQKRDTQSPGLEREGEREVGHVEDLELLAGRAGVLLLRSATKIVGRTHHHISHPCRYYLRYASGADELVKKNVGDGAD